MEYTLAHVSHACFILVTRCHFLGVVPASVCFTEGSLGLMLISGAQALAFGLDPSAKQATSIPHLWSPYNLGPGRGTELWVAVSMATAVPAGETREGLFPLLGLIPSVTTAMG